MRAAREKGNNSFLHLRKQRLRLCNFIECPYAGQAPGRAGSSRRPSPEVPRLYGVPNSSNMQIKPTVHLRAFARTAMRQPKHAKKTASGLFWPKGRDQNAHINSRADGQLKIQVHHRAHKEIQTHMPLEPNDRKSYGLYPLCSFDPLFRTRYGKVQPPTHICAFRLLTGKCQPLPRGRKASRRDFFACFG